MISRRQDRLAGAVRFELRYPFHLGLGSLAAPNRVNEAENRQQRQFALELPPFTNAAAAVFSGIS